jgi:curved DNA-binding protein CbpA
VEQTNQLTAHAGSRGGMFCSAAKFIKIQKAYEVLSDPKERAIHEDKKAKTQAKTERQAKRTAAMDGQRKAMKEGRCSQCAGRKNTSHHARLLPSAACT